MLLLKFRYTKPIDFTSTDFEGQAYWRMTEAFEHDPAIAMLSREMHQHMASLFVNAIVAKKAADPDEVRSAVHRTFRSSPLSIFGSNFLDHVTDVVLFSLFLEEDDS